MHRVGKAKLHGDESSLGNASGKLVGQFKFPYEYREDETLLTVDHDRIMFEWDWQGACKRHIPNGVSLTTWIRRRAKPEDVLAFLCDLFDTASSDPDTTFTGWRVLITINRSNGFPVYTMQLFARKNRGGTKVFTGPLGDNIDAKPNEMRSLRSGKVCHWGFG